MDPSRTSAHSPKLKVCPCLFYWVWSQKSWSCPLFCLDLRTWGAPGRPAAQPSAATPAGTQKSVCKKDLKNINMTCFVRQFTCAGVRSHVFATSMTTGSETSSACPNEEYAWKHTPYSSHTLLSSVWHSRGWNSTWRVLLDWCAIVYISMSSILLSLSCIIPVTLQEGFCSSASALSCVLVCSWTLRWPSASPQHAAPPVQPNSELCCLQSNIN